MALDFPNSPSLNDTYTSSGRTWQWNGTAWEAVTTGISANSISTTDLADNAVTTAKISNLNVTTAKIADENITAGKLATNAVTTAKILDGAVTAAKLDAAAAIQPTIVDAKGDLIVGSAADAVARLAVGTNTHVLTADSAATNGIKWAALPTQKILQVVNANKSDTFSTTSTTFADVTGLSCTITPSASTSQVFIMATLNCFAGSGGYFNARLVRGTTAIAVGDAAGSRPQASFGGFFNNQYADTRSIMWLDSPATTSATTYKVQVQLVVGSSTPTIYVNRTGADTNDSFNTRTVSSLTVLEVTA